MRSLDRLATALLASLALFTSACGDKGAPAKGPAGAAAAPAAHEDHKAPHGGEILELGEEEAHVEMLHDKKAGTLTMYVFGKDLQSPVAIAQPTILLVGKELKPTAMEPKADGTASAWKLTDTGLNTDPLVGRVRLTVGGKAFQSPLEPEGHK